MQKRRALYAGSFDPPTNGHLWMIKEGVRLFDELIVGVGTNPEKQTRFSLRERVAMLRESIKKMPRVRITQYENKFLVAHARATGAAFILRGLRNKDDFEYERALRHINADLHPGIRTVLLIPPREMAEVSSSMVIGLVGPRGWERVVKRYVPAPVMQRLRRFSPTTL